MAIALKLSKSKASVPWGFRLVGGVDFEQPIGIVKVNSDSLAESSGLQVGDLIVRINETPTAGLTHNEVHDLLFSAGLELELGIRRGEITTGIFCEDDYDIEECESIKRAIEEEVLNEAITRINNMKNKIVSDSPREKTTNIITENLTGQEEIVNTATLKTALEVKKGQKWSTFLIKPDNTAPDPKRKDVEPVKGESYKVIIKKQTRRQFKEKKVQFDQNVTELEVDFDKDETEEPSNTDDTNKTEEDTDNVEDEETYIEEEQLTNDYDTEILDEAQEDDAESQRNSMDIEKEPLEDTKEEKLGIPSSLEEQLLAVQKQLKALSQLPSAIQLTLDAVSKQLASIVNARESAERNGDQGEYTSSSKDEDEEPQTEEEYLEENSMSEKAEAELIQEESDLNSSIAEELEEDGEKQEALDREIEECEEEKEEPPSLTPEEEEAQRRQEKLEAKKEKKMEERTPKPIVRPIILPGGRKWSMPEDAVPSFRKPKMSDEKIIETIESNLEVIMGNRKGESNCWKVPSRAVARKSINFLKYQPPAKNLDYLQRSEVYRLVHDMEPPVRGITTRAEKVLAEQDYYEATSGGP